MKLIIETGASKSEWSLIYPDGGIKRIRTGGINFSSMSRDTIEKVIREAYARLDIRPSSPKEVYIYAAGMLGGEMAEYFPYSYVECASDLLAAARALFGHGRGVAAILGTGSNSCLFDGEKIVRNFHSGGYIIGDEGGSTALAKAFISDFIKELVPEPLASEFASSFKADYVSIVAGVYKNPTPAAYLGSFTPWILERYGSNDYINSLVHSNIHSFFERAASRYGEPSLGVVGGYALAIRPVIESVAAEYGMSVGEVLASPMDKLIEYHR